jgi:hypothetical protein
MLGFGVNRIEVSQEPVRVGVGEKGRSIWIWDR